MKRAATPSDLDTWGSSHAVVLAVNCALGRCICFLQRRGQSVIERAASGTRWEEGDRVRKVELRALSISMFAMGPHKRFSDSTGGSQLGTNLFSR